MYFAHTASMQASRLLSILMLLQTRGRMSARALAAELEVSVRTVLRDIDQLSAAGVPVWAERGRDGGFRLREGWSTELTGLTEPEGRALLLAGLPGPAAELGLGSAVASARLKLLATLPAPWREGALRVAQRLHLDPSDWYRARSHAPWLGAVAAAVWQQQRIRMRYESWRGVGDREVEPLGLVLKAGAWYMVARAAPEGSKAVPAEPRIYRLAAIHTMALLETGFEPPPDFDLARFWHAAAQRFEAGLQRGQAELRVSERGLRGLQQLGAAVAAAVQASAKRERGRHGWTRVTVPIESVEHASGQLLRLGAEAEVLAPPELRERLAALARAIVARYDAPRPAAASAAELSRPRPARVPRPPRRSR